MRGPLAERLSHELDERRRNGLLRIIPEHRPRQIDLSTNSYLSLHTNGDVAAAALKLAAGRLHGNLASRLICETSPLAAQLEAELANWKKTEAALLFNSGYAANIGILQAVATRDTELFSDRLNHASIIDGLRLSGCRFRRYRHSDMADLKRLVSASKAREKIIVTDSVFSMDGDCAPLPDIVDVAQTYGCCVMVDEAHATGIFGKNAGGMAEALGVSDSIDICMGTLSKAIAGVGGFLAGSTLLRDYLVNHARSLIYSTGLPPAAAAFDLAAVRHIRAHPERGRRLLEKADKFRGKLRSLGFDTLASATQIVPCRTGSSADAVALSAFLRERGIIAPAIRPPTVPKHGARIRFSLYDSFSEAEEKTVIAALKEWKKSHG
ncbi:MAG: 8-amino-7-oxononanoate synthase [Chitinispirillaceae bacterium]|nr:8-amino-7-oxononanoate synthase [Chitinispirillaceae bacterium]